MTITLNVELYSIGPINTFTAQNTIEIHLRECHNGEIVLPSGACYECIPNEYSFDSRDTKCSDCPNGAVCLGGSNVYPKPNYWRAEWDSDVLYYCPVLDICLGGEDTENPTGECEKGYRGRMCSA